eukprot:Pgem_evm1s17475
MYHTNKKTITNNIINFITDHNKVISNLRITNTQAPIPIQQVIIDQGKELYNDTMGPGLRNIGIELRTVPKNTPEMMLYERTGQTIGDITR